MNDSRTVTFPVEDTTRIVRCFVRPDGKNDTEELWTPAMDAELAAAEDKLENPIEELTVQPPSSPGSESVGDPDVPGSVPDVF